jgi:hypothetical protein
VIVRVIYMESTDAVIELPCQARQSPRWHSQQRVNLVRRQLNSELETGAGGVSKEISPETGVCQQATERPFDVALAHAARPHAKIAPYVLPPLDGRFVRLRTRMCESTLERSRANYGRTDWRARL